ncbi:MAG TPA: DUF134 domain-containing protein [Vicinamibacterales bacterium]|nr:DUF134 domain-containing protein [Vicinamibacterales bacterium]
MPRPPLPRRVCCQLNGLGFRPIGAAAAKADALRIGVDELEAIRLADIEGLYQDAAAERMGVSRQTYARILNRARMAVARSLVEQKMLFVGDTASEAILDHAPARTDCPVHGGPRRHGRACHCAEGDADTLVPYAGCRHGTS